MVKSEGEVLRRRFLAKTQMIEGCLRWTGAHGSRGYGHLRVAGSMRKAHHVAWFLAYGRWPAPDMTLDHLCRVRDCMTVEHLEEVTNKVNILRGTGVGVRAAQLQLCPQGHPFTPAPAWLKRHRRWCAPCYRARRQERKQRARLRAQA